MADLFEDPDAEYVIELISRSPEGKQRRGDVRAM